MGHIWGSGQGGELGCLSCGQMNQDLGVYAISRAMVCKQIHVKGMTLAMGKPVRRVASRQDGGKEKRQGGRDGRP